MRAAPRARRVRDDARRSLRHPRAPGARSALRVVELPRRGAQRDPAGRRLLRAHRRARAPLGSRGRAGTFARTREHPRAAALHPASCAPPRAPRRRATLGRRALPVRGRRGPARAPPLDRARAERRRGRRTRTARTTLRTRRASPPHGALRDGWLPRTAGSRVRIVRGPRGSLGRVLSPRGAPRLRRGAQTPRSVERRSASVAPRAQGGPTGPRRSATSARAVRQLRGRHGGRGGRGDRGLGGGGAGGVRDRADRHARPRLRRRSTARARSVRDRAGSGGLGALVPTARGACGGGRPRGVAA